MSTPASSARKSLYYLLTEGHARKLIHHDRCQVYLFKTMLGVTARTHFSLDVFAQMVDLTKKVWDARIDPDVETSRWVFGDDYVKHVLRRPIPQPANDVKRNSTKQTYAR